MLASFTAQHSNVETGRHRVSIRTPHPVRKNPDQSWWPTAEEARAEFERKKDELQNGEGSGLYKLSLYIDDELVDEEFVVRALHNRLYRPEVFSMDWRRRPSCGAEAAGRRRARCVAA
jgi:hypothetical protein